jgi:hypothetical protein
MPSTTPPHPRVAEPVSSTRDSLKVPRTHNIVVHLLESPLMDLHHLAIMEMYNWMLSVSFS